MIGLLSLIDNILEENILSILDSLGLCEIVKMAFINKEGVLYDFLECVKEYEFSNWDIVEKFNQNYNLDKETISSIYLESLRYADAMFSKS